MLPFRVMAPSTLGTFLRSFTFGRVRQLDAVIAETIGRAWTLGAGPGAEAMTIDLDSTICEVHGKHKQGAVYGYTKQLGYHPLLATGADTGEVLHARLRKGSSQRGHRRFVEELIARVRRAGASGALTVRADGGFGPMRWLTRSIGCTSPGRSRSTSTSRSKRRSTASTKEPGRQSPTPMAVKLKSPRQPSSRHGAVPPGREHCAWWCVAPGSPTPPKPAVARLATPRFHHQRRAEHRGRRPLPPRPRHRRARHPRPQRWRRPRALPVRAVLRQRRLVGLRRPRPQPDPLDRPPRRCPPRRSSRARTIRTGSSLSAAARQPQPTLDPAAPGAMAMGHHVPHRAQAHPLTATHHLRTTADRRPRRRPPHADISPLHAALPRRKPLVRNRSTCADHDTQRRSR